MGRTKELTKNTLIITLGRVSTQFIAFLLLPLYTTLLTTAEYGTVDFIVTLVQLLIPIVSIMIDQGVFRFLLNCNTKEERNTIISSAFFILAATSFLSIALFGIISCFYHNQYSIWLLLILIATAFSNLSLQTARGLRHTADYALGSFVCSSTTIVLNVLCIAFLRMGAVGMLIATFVGNLICTLFLFLKLKVYSYIKIASFDKQTAMSELKYSAPLVPNQLSLWVMNSSDRLIVTFFLGASANGILAISHKFPVIYMTFFGMFLLAWHETGAIHYFDEDRDQFFTKLTNQIVSIFSALCIGVMVMLPIVFDWLIKTDFVEAYYNIPIYLVASLCNVVIGILGVIYVATKKTTEIAKTTIIAAIINIIVNLSLIKFIGLYAASLSTLAGYLTTMVYRIIDAKKYLTIKYDLKRHSKTLIVLVASIIVYYIENKTLSVILLPFFIIAVLTINKDMIDGIVNFISSKTKIKTITLKKMFIIIISLLIILSLVIFANKIGNKPKQLSNIETTKIESISNVETIDFKEFNADDFTVTGMTYDTANKQFWLADYGALKGNTTTNPRLVIIDKSFNNTIKEIPLDSQIGAKANLQGITYDEKDDCIWLATGNKIIQIDKSGNKLSEFTDYLIKKYKANGIAYNKKDDTIWVLCAKKYLLHFTKEGKLMEKCKCNYADQDHIFIYNDNLYMTIGADYKGTNNYVAKFSLEPFELIAAVKTEGSNALEGICINDSNIYISNDGLYHSDKRNSSYITKYGIF